VAGSKGANSAYITLEHALYGALPQLRGLTLGHQEDFISLAVKQRADGDWLAVAKRDGPDGGPQVLFAVGFDLIGLLLNLEGSLAADRWRVDTPWKPGS
jgi:hypothetical protein